MVEALLKEADLMKSTLPFSGEVDWVLSFDFDGTLVNPDVSPQVNPEFFELLRKLRKSHRIFWGVNTGRSLQFAIQGMAEANFPFLPDFLIVRERDIFKFNKRGYWSPHEMWNEKSNKVHEELFAKSKESLRKMREWVETETAAVWGIQEKEPEGIVASSVKEMDFILKSLTPEIARIPYLAYQRNGIYLRFCHADYHKGSAMAEVAQSVGVDAEHTFAMGDGHNDVEMLNAKYAKHTACPWNANEEVKQRVKKNAGYISPQKESAGVIDALNFYFY